jgi:uncharacterized protein YegP (UPF0339 family)
MRIEVYRREDGQFGWRRRADNGNITAEGEAHTRKWNAKRAARKQFPSDPVYDLTRKGNLATRKPWKR